VGDDVRLSVRCSAVELAGFRAVVPVGMSFSEWVRRACRRAEELERALAVERAVEDGEHSV
jgi:hypothetical protein